MKMKKIIALCMSLALIGTVGVQADVLNAQTVPDTDTSLIDLLVPYCLEVSIPDGNIVMNEGESISKQLLIDHGIVVNQIMGYAHDDEDDPEYGTITPTKVCYTLDDDEWDIDWGITGPHIGTNYVQIVSGNVRCGFDFEASYNQSVEQEEPEEPEEETSIDFNVTDAVAYPGQTTYLDINIGENTGFCAVMLSLEYDESALSIESVSTTPEFTGDDYYFTLSKDMKKMIFMNNCLTNFKENEKGLIRLAFKVKEDAPDGDYTISLGDDCEICELNRDRKPVITQMTTTPGTITVSKMLDPSTNVSMMSLDRVYASMEEGQPSKTGDTNGDGNVDITDALRMRGYFLGVSDEIKNADTNEDGKLNAIDYIVMKNYLTK